MAGETVITGRSRVELGLMLGAVGAIFFGGWYARDVGRTADELTKQAARIESRLDNFPTRFELQSLVESKINSETKSLYEKFGNLDARLQAVELLKKQ